MKRKKELEALVEEQKLYKERVNKPTESETAAKETYNKLELPKQNVGTINPDLNNILTNIVTETTSEPVVKETEETLVTEGKKES